MLRIFFIRKLQVFLCTTYIAQGTSISWLCVVGDVIESVGVSLLLLRMGKQPVVYAFAQTLSNQEVAP